jgi:SAM-dependent methyltransferase
MKYFLHVRKTVIPEGNNLSSEKRSSREVSGTPLLPDELAAIIGHEERTLEGEISRVMDLLAARGIVYPVGYRVKIIQKYQKAKLFWPAMLVDVGNPNIRRHEHYQDVLQIAGDLLDYGCGTGDDLRALVADGFPQQQVRGFDVNWNTINLGSDLYLDRETWERQFTVAKSLPFPPPSFDFVYSGAVIHIFRTKKRIDRYIASAYAALKSGGVFFGFTLGRPKEFLERTSGEDPKADLWGMFLRFLTTDQLRADLDATGFTNIEVNEESREYWAGLWFYAEKG